MNSTYDRPLRSAAPGRSRGKRNQNPTSVGHTRRPTHRAGTSSGRCRDMDIFAIVLQSVLALTGIGVLGFRILKRGIIPENIISFLSLLAIDIALPCAVFAGSVLNFDPRKAPDRWQLPLW